MLFRSQASVILKIVVFDDLDYEYAHEVARRFPSIPMYLQSGNATPPQVGDFDRDGVLRGLEWLVNKVTADRWNTVTVLPQLHAILWGNKRGV